MKSWSEMKLGHLEIVRRIKPLLVVFITLLTITSAAQDVTNEQSAIDAEVKRIDNLQLPAVKFSITALKKVFHKITYTYSYNKSNYIKIHRQFSHKNDTVRQKFYLKDGQLIFATEKIVTYFIEKGVTDSITWAGSFHFAKGRLINQVTLGHGKSELETWNPEREMLEALAESKRDIVRYNKGKRGPDSGRKTN